MTEIPFELLGHQPGSMALATLFVHPDPSRSKPALAIFEHTFEFLGLRIVKYREVPHNLEVLGPDARKCCPRILQAVISRPEESRTSAAFDARLHQAKQLTRTKLKAANAWTDLFFVSLATRTVVYKALCIGEDLAKFYPDLADPRFETRFAVFHRRFSTNTRTTWDKAQPFRLVAHNGEINTITGNRSWAFTRERATGLGRDQLLTRLQISDSGSLGEMVEALKYRSSMPHLDDILAIMVPAADADGPFYDFWGRAMEPWDGPALLVYSDGESVGARLDRNGFRPARWCLTEDAFFLASENGVFDLDAATVLRKGTLRAGRGITLRLDSGKIYQRDPSEARDNAGATFDARLLPLNELTEHLPEASRQAIAVPTAQLLPKQSLFAVTAEELTRVLVPMIVTGKEPIGSMGNTARPAAFSTQPHALHDFLVQNFAQVTNPPLDYLREAIATNLTMHLGRRPNIFAPHELIGPPPALRLESPILNLHQIEQLRVLTLKTPSQLRIVARELATTYTRGQANALEDALEGLGEQALAAVRDGCSVLLLSDRGASFERPPIPSLLALRCVITTLNRHGHRLAVSLVVESGDIRSTHALACTIGFGATAACPRLALEYARFGQHPKTAALAVEVREANLCNALRAGLLKIMAKMGICVARSYQSSKPFTAYGLGPELMERFFGVPTTALQGLELPELAKLLEYNLCWAEQHPSGPLPSTYQYKEKKRSWTLAEPEGGQRHSMTAERSKIVHHLVRNSLVQGRGPHDEQVRGRNDNPQELWQAFVEQGDAVSPTSPRHLLTLRPSGAPVQPEQVESVRDILSRFGSGAMSFGAISAESQRDIFVAMRSLGARCNSGEGGENPYYFIDGTTATTKQIASGRFGVTAEYLACGSEIEIKIAQGAKPGEGGQLMGVKVDEHIAKARFAEPGVDLISPPPMHDIYSIEDLKQLIYELKQLCPESPVCVKLVAGHGVGTIAVGVAKAGADVVQISGTDGGTGAASLSSMRHAGLPWELGLLEAHQALVEHGLRSQVRLRVDGGLTTPQDIVIAAALGAQEFGLGKLLLIAQGCVMARVCEKNRCPTGIATHDPKFKAKYKGSPEHVVSLLTRLAQGVRELLATLGATKLHAVTGQRGWLQPAAEHSHLVSERKLDLSAFLAQVAWTPPSPECSRNPRKQPWSQTEQELVESVMSQLATRDGADVELKVRNTDRALTTGLSGVLARSAHLKRMRALPSTGPADRSHYPEPDTIRITLRGSAGQGLAAFAVRGLTLKLFGDAADSVAKSMSGGHITIRPPEASTFAPEDNVILGNGVLYGATGGTLFVHGHAGDRFAVRNSGATAVVEGTGLHACEYMTGGTVVILGEISANAGAGMTGGRFFIRPEYARLLCHDYVQSSALDQATLAELTPILRAYLAATGSRSVQALLRDPHALSHELVQVARRS